MMSMPKDILTDSPTRLIKENVRFRIKFRIAVVMMLFNIDESDLSDPLPTINPMTFVIENL